MLWNIFVLIVIVYCVLSFHCCSFFVPRLFCGMSDIILQMFSMLQRHLLRYLENLLKSHIIGLRNILFIALHAIALAHT